MGARAPERELLEGFIDYYRDVVVNKVDGLTRDDATRVMTPSGLSVLGVIAHLTVVEYLWFDERFAGHPSRRDPCGHRDFQLASDDTVASVIDEYRAACAVARVIASKGALDDLAVHESPNWGRVTLRWIYVHMIEETARHGGHLDLMREQIDGATGD
jgi:uncharacterized damage-inducible protein DinB